MRTGQPLLEPSGGFLQVSGVKAHYDTNLPSGKRALAIQVKTARRYDFLDLQNFLLSCKPRFPLAAGGDGYTMLAAFREEALSMDAAFGRVIRKPLI